MTDEIVSPKEVAKFLGVTEVAVYRIARQKKIPGAVRIGNQWRKRGKSTP